MSLVVVLKLSLSVSGVYTCVAWNMEGADTKSISVFVDSQGSLGSWSVVGSRQGGAPGRELPWLGNSSSAAASLVVLAKVPAVFFIVPTCVYFSSFVKHIVLLSFCM